MSACQLSLDGHAARARSAAPALPLRPYQAEALEAVDQRELLGVTRQLVVLPTGSGKTLIAAHLIAERQQRAASTGQGSGRALFLAHRDELITQTVDKLHQVAPGLEVGVVKAERDETGADVVVGSIQTLARPSRLARLEEAFDLIVCDEAHHCHLGGTLVETPDGSHAPIESLRPGDAVLAWNGTALVPRPVVRTYRHWYEGPIHEITTRSGQSVQVTPNHRLYSRGERVRASALGVGDHLSVRSLHVDNAGAQSDCDAHLVASPGVQALPGLLGRPSNAESRCAPRRASTGARHLLELRQGIWPSADPGSPGELSRQERHASARGACRSDAQAQRERSLPGATGSQDARAESNATARALREDDGGHSWQGRPWRTRRLWGAPIRQRSTPDADRGGSPSTLPGRCAGACGEVGGWGAALPLQARLGLALAEGEPGTGRLLAWNRESSYGGSAQRCPTPGDRLDDRARTEREGTLRGDHVAAVRVWRHCGWVYDIEVAEHHNYLANGVLSSNSTSPTWLGVLSGLGAMRDDGRGPLVVGITATPERSDRVGLGQIWQEIVYSRSILEMITDGYLVDARGLMVSTPADLARLRVSHGDLVDAEIGAELVRSGALGSIAEAYATHARDRKGVAFTPTVETAYSLAEALRAEGIPAEGADGAMPRELRRAVLHRLHTGQTQVVACAQLLSEGWDEPSISCVLVARPTRSRPAYIQMVGRGLRIYPGKTDCLILDVAGATARLDLMTVADLAGLSKKEVEGRTIAEAVTAKQAQETAERQKTEALKVATATAATSLFRSKLRWIEASGTFVLSVDGGMIRLEPEGTGETWRVRRDLRDDRRIVAEGLSLEYAQGLGEDQVRQLGASTLAQADAPWRERPPTDKQRAFLERNRIAIPDGATRGWAADKITALIATSPTRPKNSRGSRR